MRFFNRPITRCRISCITFFHVTLAVSMAAALETRHDETEKIQDVPNATETEYSVPEAVQQLMQDRDYDAAIKAIDTAIGNAEYSSDYLWYLKGRALTLKEDYDAAVSTFEQLVAKFPESKLIRKANLARGVALAKKADFQAAENTYKTEAEYLVSAQRLHELAMICVEYGDSYYEPAEITAKPNYERAHTFYKQAELIGLTGDVQKRVALRIARCFQENQEFEKAIELYKQYIEKYNDDPTVIEARYQLGTSLFAHDKNTAARRAFQDLVQLHANAESPRIAEAAFRISDTYGFPEPDNKRAFMLGETSLRTYLEKFPQHQRAINAELRIAEGYRFGLFEETVEHLKAFLANPRYKDNEKRAEGLYRLGLIYRLQKKFDLARATFTEYLKDYSSGSRWSEVQEKLVECDFAEGALARIEERFADAEQLWRTFMAKYPMDSRNPMILYHLGTMEFQQKNWQKAINYWEQLASKFEDSPYATKALLKIATTYETELNNIEEAIKRYKKIDNGREARLAQVRVDMLTEKKFTVVTERVFRSNETPQIQLTSRNIEKVDVNVYRIDLETYYRKNQVVDGIESLDISLINPDHQFQFSVPDYKKHLSTTNAILLQLPETLKNENNTGAWAVTINDETMEATTLVLQSDLEIAVQSGGGDVLVYAQNMLTGKPWAQAKLLISDGTSIIAEKQTGDDGVFNETIDQLNQERKSVRVLASVDGHIASSTLGGVDVRHAKKSDVGYIFTDKPIYQPQQMVHARGIIRHFDKGLAVVPDSAQYDLSVIDSDGREIHKQQVTLNAFGAFHCHFQLTSTANLGHYRIFVTNDKDEGYVGHFSVQTYQLAPVRIDVETERSVYFRGEEIKGKIKVEYYYGAPVANKEVNYTFGVGDTITGKTNDQGELEFTLQTRELDEDSPYAFTAEVPELDVQTAKTFFIATTEYQLAISTQRQLYLANEAFEIEIKALDWQKDPVQTELKIDVIRNGDMVIRSRDEYVQMQVDKLINGIDITNEYTLTTGKDGTATQSVAIKKSGRYTIRVSGKDRFGNRIREQYDLLVSGDDDQQRLRILVDNHSYQVGQTATMNIHWRENPNPALVTYVTERIVNYKIIELREGANDYQVPLDATLAPGFGISVVALTDLRAPQGEDRPNNYHFARTAFGVQPKFNLDMTIVGDQPDKALTPGQEIEVQLISTDADGKPISTDISLAMVQQSLMQIQSYPYEAALNMFAGDLELAQTDWSASSGFAYRPTTKKIDLELLSEQERIARREAEEEWLAANESRNQNSNAGANGPDLIFTRTGPTKSFTEQEWKQLNQNILSDSNMIDEFGVIPGQLDEETISNIPQMLDTDGDGSTDPFAYELQGNGAVFGRPNNVDGIRLEAAYNSDNGVTGQFLSAEDFQRNIPQMGGGFAPPRSSHNDGNGSGLLGGIQFGERESSTSFDISSEGNGQPFITTVVPTVDSSSGENNYAQRLLRKPTQTNDLAILSRDGVFNVVNFQYAVTDKNSKQAIQALVSSLNSAGFALHPQIPVSETGYWNPSVITDEQGKATVKITMPSQSTQWKLMATGISKNTLTTFVDQSLTVKKGLFGEIRLPTAYTDGDQTKTRVTIHNSQFKEGIISVELKTTIGDKTVSQKMERDEDLIGIHELVFENKIELPADLSAGTGANVQYELIVSSGDATDITEKVVPIQPYGITVYATRGGVSQANTAAKVTMPEGTPFTSPHMQIIVGPNIESSLYDVLLGQSSMCQFDAVRYATTVEQLTSDILAGVALEKLHQQQHPDGSPIGISISNQVRVSLLSLMSLQLKSGGWSWSRGSTDQNSRAATARALWAISAARKAGYKVDQKSIDRALEYVQTQLPLTSVSDYESKAVLLHAVTVAGQSDFTTANQLYRNRNSLSAAGLAYLSLTFAEMDRKNTATELVQVFVDRGLENSLEQFSQGKLEQVDQLASMSWNRSEAELRALLALAIENSSRDAELFKKQKTRLLDLRRGNRWAPDKATGPATMALASSQSRIKSPLGDYTLDIAVNDKPFQKLTIKTDSQTQVLTVPAELLVAGADQQVRFQIEGRGEYSYQCIFSGFVNADLLAESTRDWTVRRNYQPDLVDINGKQFERGFTVVSGSAIEFRNELTQLPIGQRGRVDLQIQVPRTPGDSQNRDLNYLVVTEPIPAGASIVENSIEGDFERYVILPGEIQFYLGPVNAAKIYYQLHGVSQGDYRVRPTVVRNSFQLDQMAVAKARPLAILAADQKSTDSYRMTPDELYRIGLYYKESGNLKTATEYLAKLIDDWNIKNDAYRDAVTSLFEMHLQGGTPEKIVEYFEIIIEKYPQQAITFDNYLTVARAYHDMGEYERSYLVYRATLQASFARESTIPGFLQQEGEFQKSTALMQQLISQYPPESYVATARYALSQQVYAYAEKAASDKKLKEQKISRFDLIERASRMLDDYLTEHPNDPSADEASFSRANAMLDLKRYDAAINACSRYAQRYPDSTFLDSFWYVMGYCYFADGAHEKAIEMCKKVADAKITDPKTQRETESKNKWRAIYILGQIYHSLGQAKMAIDYYEQVKDRFFDAKQAIEYFAREELKFDEVHTFKPGEEASIKLKYRNVHDCRLTVYKIDLMKFSLLQRDLSNVTDINLSGIRPYHQLNVELKPEKTYREENETVEIPVKEDGAYLVVCTSDKLYASGLLLVSPLAIEVSEDVDTQRVRVTLKDSLKDEYLDDVHIKVIASANKDISSGETDLRGVYVADDINGKVTVIAKTPDNQYAFYRGSKILGNQPAQQTMQQMQNMMQLRKGKQGKEQLLDDLKGDNQKILEGNSIKMEKMYKSDEGKNPDGGFGGGGFGGGGVLGGGK